jgi:hypothetical protein
MFDKPIRYWAVTGRVLFDDEDTGHVFGPCTEDEATTSMLRHLLEDNGHTAKEIEERMNDENGCGAVICCVFSSESPIRLERQNP